MNAKNPILLRNPYRRPLSVPRKQRGFALVVTVSMMLLLVTLGVGLLGMSSLSLSNARQNSELAEARSNARVALMMALAQLQRHTGPDQCVTIPANQLSELEDGGSSGSSHWTGVYGSWAASDPSRPTPQFRSWLVSGEEDQLDSVDFATSPPSGRSMIEMVGAGTLGKASSGSVQVPSLEIDSPRGDKTRIGWWTGDQNVKATLYSPRRQQPASVAETRAGMQSPARHAIELCDSSSGQPYGNLAPDDHRVEFVTGWQQGALLGSDPETPRELFHDIAPFSSGLLTNVRAGGFRKDLSMELEKPVTRAPDPTRTALYRVGNENGINLQELWVYYNLNKNVRRAGAVNFTTGGRLSPQAPALQTGASATACANDHEFFLKQPVIVSYQVALSLEVFNNQLRVVADPILTFWNPLDVPVVVPRGTFFSVKYWQIPYDLHIFVNGGAPVICPLIAAFSRPNEARTDVTDYNYLSLRVGNQEQMVFKPGEVIKYSQMAAGVRRDSPDHTLEGRAGFNHGGGISFPLRDRSFNPITVSATDNITYEARPNNLTAGKTSRSGNSISGTSPHTRHFSTTHHEYYIGGDRPTNGGAVGSLGFGGIYVDWDFGNRRIRPGEVRLERQEGTKPPNERLSADRHPQVFKPITRSDGRPLAVSSITSRKEPIMLVSYHAKTEDGGERGTRSLARFNPRAFHMDFYDLSNAERDMLPYEFMVTPLNSWKNRHLETSGNGNAYFGGGMNAEFGTTHVVTHSVPREPIWSLAAFQHSFANGFEFLRPVQGYAAINPREPMLPHISHAIGNSMAPSVMAPERTQSALAGNRPMADHSYLANLNLWDDWFLSGIAPQNSPSGTFAASKVQRVVAEEFFRGTGKLPVSRYLPDIGEETPESLLSALFGGSTPRDTAAAITASLIRVDGMFNVNSTSVEAWKALLASTRRQPVVVRDEAGSESVVTGREDTPVTGLLSPANMVAPGKGNARLGDAHQWTGRRELTDGQIQALAEAMVRQVRLRGPFTSLADFVNRRPGRNNDLARCGAVQAAIDDTDINEPYSGSRGVSSSAAGRFQFPQAETGPISYGAPGIVKQADILTPIAPVLSVRSDSFIIRAYGEATDREGKVLARAWCEAVVERSRDFVDPVDPPQTAVADLDPVNRTFGRRYDIVSFRWLHPDEV